MIYLILFWEFFKIGTFAAGGGIAAMPFLFSLAERYPWYTHEMLVDMIAVSEIAPGPIGVKMSTYAGYSAAGVLGGLVATLGIIAPGVIMMLLMVKLLSNISENKHMQSIFYGLRPAVTALIVVVGLEIAKFTVLDFFDTMDVPLVSFLPLALLVLLILEARYIKRMSPIMMIGIAAVVGAVFRF